MTERTYYAHSSGEEEREWQRLDDHLTATAERASAFLQTAGHAELGHVAGLLHDLGKYTDGFQARLAGNGTRVDHSTAGALVAIDTYGRGLGKMLAFCIAGHHAGLANGTNGERITALADRLGNKVAAPDHIWKQEIALPGSLVEPPWRKASSRESAAFSAAFLIRMTFSALVDADFLDTEAYHAAGNGEPISRGEHPGLAELQRRLDAHLNELGNDRSGGKTSPINTLRSEVLGHARKQAVQPPGLFTLTVPTGGGKTLTSLAFSLDHALRHGLERVIYVIPYMSIIEQTAAVFRAKLRERDGDPADFVVEHHSTFDEDQISRREGREKLRLAMENWDAPIIVTTAVQFFESLFANRPSRCRKLHNIANSVVILDEAQTLPLHLLRPCVAALDELARNWRTSIVLCTATQPALRQRDGFPSGFKNVRELAPDPPQLYMAPALKRTRIRDAGTLEDAELADRLRKSPQVLCIVNTRRHARELYEEIGDAGGSCHLSTLMCAAHRREALKAVRKRLKAGEPVRLVATSLVEAGVDVDFPVVWRAAAGLESIIQAAGRCNREGRRDSGDVFVFEPTGDEGRKAPAEVAQNADAAMTILRRPGDPAGLEAIRAYFQRLYWVKGDKLDSKDIMPMIREELRSRDFPFETIARKFRLIDKIQAPVVTPWAGTTGTDGTAERLLEKLKYVERPGGIARRLQPYIVQIPYAARNELLEDGAVAIVGEAKFGDQFVRLVNGDLYQEDTGLSWENPTHRQAEGLVY